MKYFKFIIILVCFATGYANGQKAKVQTAYNFYKVPYQQFDKAKEAIDEAILNEQSAAMAKTWYYRGLIYQALYNDPKYGQLCNNCLMTAYESYQKANEIEPGNEWKQEIENAKMLMANQVFQSGINNFNSKAYDKALTDFELVQKISPADTAIILNSALAAEKSGNQPKAKEYYSKLIEWKYPDSDLYVNLSNIYKNEKDTVKALEVLKNGRALYPDSLGLLLAEINIYLAGNRPEEASKALDVAVQKDPTNVSLYEAWGSTYENLANPKQNGKELAKPAKYDEYIAKAEEAYKKGLAIDPENYAMNFSLGGMYFNQAAAMVNSANTLKSTDEFNKAKIKYDQKFRQAQPYLEKALEKNPRATEEDKSLYAGTVTSLKQLYVRLNDTENYNRMKAIDEQK